ncbi:MAG: prohibitin family protein [Methylovulum sp.]|nr:prohibitin family protein [Methylovulum sp.]
MRYLPISLTSTIIILILLMYFQPLIFITIKAGEEGVLYRRFAGGTVTDQIFKEGFHIVLPWNKMTVYDTRIQQKSYDFSVLTAEGLKTELSLSIRYYPRRNALGALHQQIGPDYLEKVVIPEVDNTLRILVGQMDIDELYTSKGGGLQSLITKSISEIERNYVVIEDVVLRQIILPKKVEAAIETKIEQKQLAQAYQYRLMAEEQEAKRKKLEAEGIKEYNAIVAESLSADILKWKGIQATQALAESNNAKIVVVGNGGNQLPIILGGETKP